MENLSNVEVWLTKVCGSRSRVTYAKEIRNFAKFVLDNFQVDLNALRDRYRTAKYAGEAEKDKFLDRIHDIVEVYSCQVKRSNYTSMHEALILSIIRSYLVKGCGIKDVEVPLPKHVFVTFHNRDLKKEDIKRILDHANLRDKVFFLMMAESGMRPQTLVQLNYNNIKEDFEANRIPMKIELPSLILKDNPSPRFTFIGEDSFRLLKEYLSDRGRLADDEPLFAAIRPGSMKSERLKMEVFSCTFGRIAQKAGLVSPAKSASERRPRQIRLYGLRKYFNNNMRTDRAYIEFWMGHTDAKQHYISTDAEEHRKRYAEGYSELRVYSRTHEMAKVVEEQNRKIEELREENVNLKSRLNYLATSSDATEKQAEEIKDLRTQLVKSETEKENLKERMDLTEQKLSHIEKLIEDLKKQIPES
jgi:integrase